MRTTVILRRRPTTWRKEMVWFPFMDDGVAVWRWYNPKWYKK
jgi:hypothetical protein